MESSTGRRVRWIVAIFSVAIVVIAGWVHFSSGTSEVSNGKAKAKPTPTVHVAESKRGSLPLSVEYRGELSADVTDLAAQGSGHLLDVSVNLGDHFKKNDVLARVDAGETRRLLGEARAQAQSAEATQKRIAAQLEKARVEETRGKSLLNDQLVSEQQVTALSSEVQVLEAEVGASDAQRAAALARVELYREQLSKAELRAPFDGAVATRFLMTGDTVASGTPVLRLIKSGPLEILFRASELHVARLTPGTRLMVTTLATGDEVFEGTLARVSAEVSRTDRAVAAEGVLSQENSALRSGMYATVQVSLGTLEDAVLLPSSALTSKILADGSSERGVYRLDGEKVVYKKVTVLGEHNGQVALSGIEAGQQIVIEGQDSLSDGSQVRIAQEDKTPDDAKTPKDDSP